MSGQQKKMSTKKNTPRNRKERKMKGGMTVRDPLANLQSEHVSDIMGSKSKGKPQYVPLQKKIPIPKDTSSIIKEHVDFLQDDNMEDDFDPPFHSTAVYADEDESLEKEELVASKAAVHSLQFPSLSKMRSPIDILSKTKSLESKEDSSVQNTVIEKTQKTPKKAHSPVRELAEPYSLPKDNQNKRMSNRNRASRKVHSPLEKSGPSETADYPGKMGVKAVTVSQHPPTGNKRKRKPDRNVSPQKRQTPFQKQASPTNESSESEVDQEAHTLHVTPKSKKQRTKSNKSLASRKVHSPLQKSGPSQKADSPGNMGVKAVTVSQHPPTGNKRKRKPDRNVSPQKRQTPFQKQASPTNESSESEVDQEAHTLHVTPKSKKRRTKSNKSLGTPRKIQDTSTEKEQKKLKTKASSGSGKKKAVSLKPWSSEEVPRSSRDLNELDVVLFECENVFEDFRATINSDATIKAIDLFFDGFKNQLVKSIEDAQKLKNLKRKNTKMQSEIGMKQKRLISVKYEVIQNESKLKALQKKYSDLQEKHTALKNAKHFLSNLGDLQKSYLKFREKKPNTTETYGISSLPALLLESQTIMNPEKHIRDINSKLENIVGDEKNAL
ncbi:Hypothetical predicted protein [Pelobates cultripes]|uniref:Centromere protein U n=1 Tax=Pelobates cultripes TaxID=61616 RepID=A0AAD1SK97_PELCU|nr:Hypothetical predicted protein [Pelobates cultripes]